MLASNNCKIIIENMYGEYRIMIEQKSWPVTVEEAQKVIESLS